MPGVIMADGPQNGARTDHDRGQGPQTMTEDVASMPTKPGAAKEMTIPMRPRMNDLPDEIVHITQGFVPLSLLVTRLAQHTHNSLQEKIAELAKMALPASALNGTTSHSAQGPDDTSTENLHKKGALLHFAQDMHAKWIKALVITEWSRNASLVSKLIDLKFHIDQQRILFDGCLDDMVNVKRDLTFARMPSPDLKTALQVLSTGNAPWVPDLGYIEPAPLTAQEKLKWINDLDTLLSLRLNIEDYDNIPPQFRDYRIESGRVTFQVATEFEVELTIADEDFEKQFWFIDFRYLFGPSAATIPDSLRSYLETCVNDVLSKDGLSGCYKFLHEFVLTSKINELKRQAIELSKTSWSSTLVVEPLNRALAIQYWSSRTNTTGLKNWVLIAIESGKTSNSQTDASTTSRLVAKWYRDNKEVKDATLELDLQSLSAESLLKDVVGRHIDHILSSIRDKLSEAPRFKQREAKMSLHLSRSDPAACALTTEVTPNHSTSLIMEPTTGIFAIKPQSKFSVQYEMQLNNGKNVAEDGVLCVENVRCAVLEDALNRSGTTMGWTTHKAPLSQEEFRLVTKLRDWTRTIWIQKEGWGPNWYIATVLSLSGDEWWLLEINRNEPGRACKFHTKLPVSKGQPSLSDRFWNNLTLFATGSIARITDLRELHRQRIKSRSSDIKSSTSQQVKIPALEMDLSALVPSMAVDSASNKQSWASNIVIVQFGGLQPAPKSSNPEAETSLLMCTTDAILKVRNPGKFTALDGNVDHDLSYNPAKGEFGLRIRHAVGEPILAILQSRIKSIDRFVNFLEAVERSEGAIVSEEVSLQRVAFKYGAWSMALDLSRGDIDISIDEHNPHLRVLDLMRVLVNSDGGITALLGWLPASLSAMEALDSMETAWEDVKAGTAQFAVKTLGWMSVRYSILGKPDVLTLEVQRKLRRGEAWWHVWRSDKNAEGDMFSAPLKAVWVKNGAKWIGLSTGAAGKPDGGVVEMMLATDEAIRRAVGEPKKEEADDVVLIE